MGSCSQFPESQTRESLRNGSKLDFAKEQEAPVLALGAGIVGLVPRGVWVSCSVPRLVFV